MPAIDLSEPVTEDLPTIQVWTSAVLSPATWASVPYLYLTRLELTCAPAVDRAEFSYDYGAILQGDATQFAQVNPLWLEGKFVKVLISAALFVFVCHCFDWFCSLRLP